MTETTNVPRVTISLGSGSLITLQARVKSILLTRYSGEEVVISGHEVQRVLINLDIGSLLAEEDNNEPQRQEQGQQSDLSGDAKRDEQGDG